MGEIRHKSIIIIGTREKIVKAHKEAKKIFKQKTNSDLGSQIISPVIQSFCNQFYSFYIAPDGSKEGWDTNMKCNDARQSFLDWLNLYNNYCNHILIEFEG